MGVMDDAFRVSLGLERGLWYGPYCAAHWRNSRAPCQCACPTSADFKVSTDSVDGIVLYCTTVRGSDLIHRLLKRKQATPRPDPCVTRRLRLGGVTDAVTATVRARLTSECAPAAGSKMYTYTKTSYEYRPCLASIAHQGYCRPNERPVIGTSASL